MFRSPFEREAVARALIAVRHRTRRPRRVGEELAASRYRRRHQTRARSLRLGTEPRPDLIVCRSSRGGSRGDQTGRDRPDAGRIRRRSPWLRPVFRGLWEPIWFADGGIDDDPVLPPILLVLSGIGLMSMVALRDPLRTRSSPIPSLGVSAARRPWCVLVRDFEASRLREVEVPLPGAGAGVAVAGVRQRSRTSGAKVNLWRAAGRGHPLLVIFALSVFRAAPGIPA